MEIEMKDPAGPDRQSEPARAATTRASGRGQPPMYGSLWLALFTVLREEFRRPADALLQ
jgi:hypothetical protein